MLSFFFYTGALIVIGALIIFHRYHKRKEDAQMVDVYLALIVGGKRTLAQVPARYQAEVKDCLTAIGLDENGNSLTA